MPFEVIFYIVIHSKAMYIEWPIARNILRRYK